MIFDAERLGRGTQRHRSMHNFKDHRERDTFRVFLGGNGDRLTGHIKKASANKNRTLNGIGSLTNLQR